MATIDIHDGRQQINPAATTATQNVYLFGDRFVEQYLNEHLRETKRSVETGIVDSMCLHSVTLPEVVSNEIRRKSKQSFWAVLSGIR